MIATRTKPPTSSRKSRSSRWIRLKHPFRLFYFGIIFLLVNLVAALFQVLVTPSSGSVPDLRTTYIWRVAAEHPLVFICVVAVCLVLAGIGWLFDRQAAETANAQKRLPLARDLKAASFKLGDDLAAQAPYIISPVQEVYLKAVNVLHDASVKAPGTKSGLLVMGVANAGKTRLAFEVVRKALPNWRVFIWRVDDAEPPGETFADENVIIFIDDLQEHAPSEVRYSRGASQTLDMRALALQKMVQDVRSGARQVVIVATCRTEDEVRTRARMGWLFAELATVEVPLFPLQGPEAETIISEFRDQALQRIKDWDGTLGSLVLGLSAKRQSYAELVIERDPATRVLQAMKLLTLAGIEKHTERRLRAICTDVFFRTDLGRGDVWRDTVDNLIRMQFVMEGPNEGTLIIRKDSYFEQVITDYPSPDRATQFDRDLEKTLTVFSGIQDVEAVFHLGNTFYHLKQYVQSLDAYERVLNLGAFSDAVQPAVVWRNKGAVLQSQKKYDQAIGAYDRALQLDPTYASAWRNKGDIQQELENYSAAIIAYDRALLLEPHYTAALNSKGQALNKMGRRAEALVILDEALTIDPRYDFAWRNKGDVLSALERYSEAIAAYDQAIEINPDYTYAWNGKGVVHREMGRYAEALAAFDKALELDPKLWYAWNGRGATLRDQGKYDEALNALDHALQLNPDYAGALKNQGTVFEKVGRYAEALAAFDKALAQVPSYPAARTGRGLVFAAQGHYTEALDEFDKALQSDPSYIAALQGKAQALEHLGQKELAATIRAQAQAAAAEGRGAEQQESAEEARDQERMSQKL
jgi:tetratricopeptide (TPR) repeat protein